MTLSIEETLQRGIQKGIKGAVEKFIALDALVREMGGIAEIKRLKTELEAVQDEKRLSKVVDLRKEKTVLEEMLFAKEQQIKKMADDWYESRRDYFKMVDVMYLFQKHVSQKVWEEIQEQREKWFEGR